MAQHFDQNNPWAWWQSALLGDFGAIHDGLPQQGYYRVRNGKGGDWLPVAIWMDAGNEWAALKNGHGVRAEDIWSFACRHPVTYEAYERASRGEGWADEPPAAVGHNSAGLTDPIDVIRAELAAETETAAGFLAKPISDQDIANQAGIWAKRVGDLAKRADSERETEKKPHLEASRAVDAKWRPVVEDAKDLATRLKRHVEPFLIEQKRKADEAARLAREEAEKVRREAEERFRKARETEGAADRAREEADAAKALAAAREAERQSVAAPANARAGRTGATVALRTEKRANVVDYDACLAALKDHPDMKALVEQLAQRAVRAGVPLAGVEVVEIQKAA